MGPWLCQNFLATDGTDFHGQKIWKTFCCSSVRVRAGPWLCQNFLATDAHGRKDKNKTFLSVWICVGSWLYQNFIATDTHGRKDKNKAFFVGVGPCESVAISVTYFLQWLVLFRNE